MMPLWRPATVDTSLKVEPIWNGLDTARLTKGACLSASGYSSSIFLLVMPCTNQRLSKVG